MRFQNGKRILVLSSEIREITRKARRTQIDYEDEHVEEAAALLALGRKMRSDPREMRGSLVGSPFPVGPPPWRLKSADPSSVYSADWSD